MNPIYYEAERMPAKSQSNTPAADAKAVQFPALGFVDLFAGIGGFPLIFERSERHGAFSYWS